MLNFAHVPILFPLLMTKLSRKQIKEGLDQVPIDVLLTGTRNNRLTHKQKEFAKELALGNTKAGAYRKAYNTKANKKVQANKGSELSLRDDIRVEVEAIKEAIEFNKSHTMAQLRALVISQLTKEALNGENPPASRLTAIKALGEVSGVDAFIHRTETKIIKDSDTARAEIMEQLRKAMGDSLRTINEPEDDPLSLLSELAEARKQKDEIATPPHPTPQESPTIDGGTTHSIPHKSPPKVSDSSHAPVSFRKEEGVGGTKDTYLEQYTDSETPPVTNWKAKG
jgi:hypothetical protein